MLTLVSQNRFAAHGTHRHVLAQEDAVLRKTGQMVDDINSLMEGLSQVRPPPDIVL
jgi:hypothetical protein